MSGKRLALITGSAAGLGAGIAERLAAAGYRVHLTHRPGGTAPDAALARVRRFDSDALSSSMDVRQPEQLESLVREVEQQRGTIDVLIHAAGPMTIKRIENADFAVYDEMMRSNMASAVALSLAVLPGMRERKFGRCIFFGMTGSAITRPARGLAFYAAAKAAVVLYAKSLALEEAVHGITSNVIEPGDIRDKMRSRAQALDTPASNPTGHAGSWEDIADAVLYLIGDSAQFVNGAVLSVGGGLVNAHE
jgi:NAD(P)-dependent dehydrogenase (short-subunit alcohol dehydrogenase family)